MDIFENTCTVNAKFEYRIMRTVSKNGFDFLVFS